MMYLISNLWFYLLLACVIGVCTGWLTRHSSKA